MNRKLWLGLLISGVMEYFSNGNRGMNDRRENIVEEKE